MPNHLAAQAESCDLETYGVWSHVPDNLLLLVFSYLKPGELLTATQVCKQWHCVGLDDLLWKDLLYREWNIDRSIPRAPGKLSWLSEFQRLYCRIPMLETEVIREHRDQVLHVSFSHNGKMISSCSKDGSVKVWNSTYPISLKCYADMKELTWKYTQYSAFNKTDTHLLVSGVHFGSNSTSGEIVVFNLQGDKFELQCRVLNKPYDVFGSWYNNDYLLSGNIHWQGNYTSCSVLWLNKASQALESEHESVVMRLYKFLNVNASSVRTIMVADCLDEDPSHVCPQPSTSSSDPSTSSQHPQKPSKTSKKIQTFCEGEGRPVQLLEVDDLVSDEAQLFGTIEYGKVYREAEGWRGGEGVDVQMSVDGVDHCAVDVTTPSSSDGENDQSFELLDDVGDNHSAINETVVLGTQETTGGANCGDRLDVHGQSVHTSTSDNSLLSSCSCHSNSSSDTVSSSSHVTPLVSTNRICANCQSNQSGGLRDKYLVFTMGTKTYTPHQIGIKRITAAKADEVIQAMKYRIDDHTIPKPANPTTQHVVDMDEAANQNADDIEDAIKRNLGHLDPANQDAGDDGRANQLETDDDQYDEVDHLIELHGHIIGMCLSPDHRYLYVNCRPWPKNYIIDDPLYPPPIAQEIDIHVIDLVSMKQVGMMHRAHKAYTPNDECFFIFLDVCKEYVASGAENKHGYLWDRHYGVCLARYPHADVVNCVAFNPCDPEVLITVSDDHSLKIWRSRHRAKQLANKCKT